MIAPIRQTEQPVASASLRAARRLVARTLLEETAGHLEQTTVPAWRAWLFVAWMTAVIASYGAHLLGWF